jgi:predicted transposase/invertase (TIGR01784 family)
LLVRANVPKEEIDEITDKIQERRLQEMFSFIDGYDVQETRRVAKAEGKVEGKAEGKIEAAGNMKAKGFSVADISEITGLSVEEIQKL